MPPISSMPKIWIFKEGRTNNDKLTIDGSEMPPCPAYVGDYTKAWEVAAKEIVAARIADKVTVKIYHNNESGDWKWSVVDANDPEFWLNSFDTKQKALDFCEKHGLFIVEVIKRLKDGLW